MAEVITETGVVIGTDEEEEENKRTTTQQQEEVVQPQPEEQPQSVPAVEPEGETSQINPLFDLSEDEVRLKYELNEITPEAVKDWKTVDALRKGGLYDLSEDRIRYAYERGLVTTSQVKDWKDYQENGPEWNPENARGLYELYLQSEGMSMEEVDGHLEAPSFFMDPVDVVIDVGTGAFIARSAVGATKKLAEVGKDVVYGRIAAGTMDLIDKAGGGTVSQIFGAILSPAAAQALATASRRQLITIFKGFGKNNPKKLEDIKKVVTAHPEDPMSKKLKAVLEELGTQGIWQKSDVDGVRHASTKQADIEDSKKVLEGLIDQNEAQKILDEQLGSEHLAGYTDKLVERVRQAGMSGYEIMAEISGVFDKVAKAGGYVSDKAAEAHVQRYVKELSNNLGMNNVKTEKMLQLMHDTKLSMQQMNVKARVINEAFLSYQKQVKNLLDEKIFSTPDPVFADVLEAMEHIRVLAEMQEAFMAVRGEFGRGLRVYHSDQMMKNRFDFKNMSRADYEALKNGHQSDMIKALKYWSDAKTPKVRLYKARNLMKNRWLKGILELEQASLLSHWKTQVVNIVGSSMAAANEMATRYAGINYRAWKLAGGWKRPFSRDDSAMMEWQLQKEAWKEALTETLKVKGGWSGLVKNPREAFFSEETGTFWKALMTSEPQLDKIMKYEGQTELGALPTYLNLGFMKLPFGKIIRLPFHGLTAGDEIFKSIGYRMEVNRQLYRKAVQAGAETPEQIASAIKRYLNDGIPAELHEAAIKQSRYQTFTDEFAERGFLSKFEGMMNTGPGILTRILAMPFFRVTINLPKYALQQTPLGAVARWQRDVIKNGTKTGASLQEKQALAELLARWSLGTSVLATGIALHQQGKITGRTPIDQRDIHQAAGVQPYSWVIHKDDGSIEFIDFNRIDPHAFLFGIGADLSAAYDMMQWYNKDKDMYGASEVDMSEVVFAYLSAFTAPLMEKTIAKSLKDTMDAAMTAATNDNRMRLDKYARRQLEKFYPRALDMVHEFTGADKYLREARTVSESFWKKWVPEKAPKMRHQIYGDVVERQDRVALILNRRVMEDDPVMRMLVETGTNVGEPTWKGRDRSGLPWEFTPAQQTEFLKRISESDMKQHLKEKAEALKAAGIKDDHFIAQQLKKTISTWRGIIRDLMLYQGDEPILTREQIEKRMQLKADAVIGEAEIRHKTARTYNFLHQGE